jgi:HAMP domain-containing protein
VDSVSSGFSATFTAAVQKPAWLIEMSLASSTVRLSSYDTVTWSGNDWTGTDVRVEGFVPGALTVRGSLVFGNADDTYGALFLLNNPTDRRIRLWRYDAAMDLATSAPKLKADAVGAAVQIGEKEVQVGLRDACEYRLGPRAVVSKAYGFNTLIPAGRTLVINNISFVLERGR